MWKRTLAALLLGGVAIPASTQARVDKPLNACLTASGGQGVDCIHRALKRLDGVVSPAADALDDLLAATEPAVTARCTTAQAETLGSSSLEDHVFRINQACTDFAFDFNGLVFRDDQTGLTPTQDRCRARMYKHLRRLRRRVTRMWSVQCIVREYNDRACNRELRDVRLSRARTNAEQALVRGCGADFDAVAPFDGATVDERIATFVDIVITRSRHYALRVYPPRTTAPISELGPYPVGVTTLELVDPSRLNTAGTGPRPVTVEVYYPSTAAAIEGHPRDVVRILGLDIVETPSYRDVERAPGTYPLVVFSHGNNGIRVQSFYFAANLASNSYIVASPDHHGNTFVDTLMGIFDGDVAVNRPLDMSFVVDELLSLNTTPGTFFENAIDPARIGASGHSFGGFTTFALAAGAFADPRIACIMPHAPAALFPDPFFADITIPTLIVGGSIDETTPFATQQQRPYDLMLPGAKIVALAELAGAGHFTFSDFCEVPPGLLGFLGGADEACEPRHLPWRYAQDLVKYLSLNFFDAVLKDDDGALAALSPAAVGELDDIRFESK